MDESSEESKLPRPRAECANVDFGRMGSLWQIFMGSVHWPLPAPASVPVLVGSGPWTSFLSEQAGVRVPLQPLGRRAEIESFCCPFCVPVEATPCIPWQGEAQASLWGQRSAPEALGQG